MQTFNTRSQPEIISYRIIRRSVGILGMAMPFALLMLAYILGCRQMQPSVSDYYFTAAGSLFVGILCAVGLFLISYKGYGPLDDFATNMAGVFAFGIAFFPTEKAEGSCMVLTYVYSDQTAVIHYFSSAIFFLTLSYISFFLFTRSKEHKTVRKVIRNKIYRSCAVLMLISAALVPVFREFLSAKTIERYTPTFWLECFALLNFGVSWLIKGETLYRDKASKINT